MNDKAESNYYFIPEFCCNMPRAKTGRMYHKAPESRKSVSEERNGKTTE